MNIRDHLKDVKERLTKVVYVEPLAERGGRSTDGMKVLLDDAKWLAAQLEGALDEIDQLVTPKEYA